MTETKEPVSEVEFLRAVLHEMVGHLNWIYREPKLIGPIMIEHLLKQHDIQAWTVARKACESYVSHMDAWKAYKLDKSGLKIV